MALEWRPGPACADARRIACDLEHEGRFATAPRVPGCGAGGVGIESWLATEVIAKLIDLPILAFLKAYGLASVEPDGLATFDLASFGGPGTARLLLARSTDRIRAAAFGMLENRSAF